MPKHSRLVEGDGDKTLEYLDQLIADEDLLADVGLLEEVALEKDRQLSGEIVAIERSIEAFEERERKIMQRSIPSPGDWLAFALVILLPSVLIMHVLYLHMGELHGWGATERFDALLETVQGALTTAGGGEGPLNMVGQVLWLLVEVVVAIAVVIPLGILRFLQIIVPDAETLMFYAEGAAIALIVLFLLRFNPIGQYRAAWAEYRSVNTESLKEAREAKRQLGEKRAQRDMIRKSEIYQAALEKKR